MNDLQIFESEQFGKIRTVMIDGEPWFVGNDITRALGYVNPKGAVKKHVDSDDRRVLSRVQDGPVMEIPAAGITVVNESGLYSLIFGSQLDKAKEFKHWVTHDVLPTLRKTGTYIAHGRESVRIEPPAVPLGALVRLMEFQERNMKERGYTPYEIASMATGTMNAYGVVVTKAFTKEVDPQLCLFDAPALPSDAPLMLV